MASEKENALEDLFDRALTINERLFARVDELLAEIELLKGNTAVARHYKKKTGQLMRENERLEAVIARLHEENADLMNDLSMDSA